MPNPLSIVNKFFPKVTKVRDATSNIEIEVTKTDQNIAKKMKHDECAMAVACKRKMHLDGVIMAISTAYLIKDNVATRYKVPISVGREITSFDRGAPFAVGTYKL